METTSDVSLNPGTIHTTHSSYYTRSKSTTTTLFSPDHSHSEPLIQIGLGLQGAIFEHIALPGQAIKKEHPHNAVLPTNLLNEVGIHHEVWKAFQQWNHLVTVKVPIILSSSDNLGARWADKLSLFPPGYQAPSRIITMERILPLTKEARRALVLNKQENKHCLVRTYLGRGKGRAKPRMDEHGQVSLRNFPLYLEGLREMGVDVVRLAEEMGRAVAVMHWGAGVDGDDVEFVLGTEQVEGVYQEFRGAMVMGDNRDFIPSCLDEENKGVWEGFRRGYVAAGKTVLKERGLEDRYDVEVFMRSYEEYAGDFL
ncbi:hypothetical protein QBC41DRAFT_229040 [Cercophora samala]|uniref:DUF3669 domain-containing protein n=1 Tax=Cercophora samala TaxID=330535 RepID=A0AA39ZA90_9PEZI|nr:hypothetical protein QBC41DRAFT_229040 [Cercophora samala]